MLGLGLTFFMLTFWEHY